LLNFSPFSEPEESDREVNRKHETQGAEGIDGAAADIDPNNIPVDRVVNDLQRIVVLC
jgi:hypothetical protein